MFRCKVQSINPATFCLSIKDRMIKMCIFQIKSRNLCLLTSKFKPDVTCEGASEKPSSFYLCFPSKIYQSCFSGENLKNNLSSIFSKLLTNHWVSLAFSMPIDIFIANYLQFDINYLFQTSRNLNSEFWIYKIRYDVDKILFYILGSTLKM